MFAVSWHLLRPVLCCLIWATSQVTLPGNLLAARLSKEWPFTPLPGRNGKPLQSLTSQKPWVLGPFPYLLSCLFLLRAAFVPAPPVAPVPAPAPMPPVHPPPPMEDEPTSKKLKTEDSLMPEDEFLRRNKVWGPRVLPVAGRPSPAPVTHPGSPYSTVLASGPRSAAGGLGRVSEYTLDVGSAVGGTDGVGGPPLCELLLWGPARRTQLHRQQDLGVKGAQDWRNSWVQLLISLWPLHPATAVVGDPAGVLEIREGGKLALLFPREAVRLW